MYAHIFDVVSQRTVHQPLWLALSLGALVLAGALVGCVWLLRLDERRLDYRALSEALRVRCWWSLAGIGKSAADSYLNQLRTEMAWARRALQSLAPPPAIWRELFDARSDEEKCKCLAIVCDTWVKGQLEFFMDKKRGHHKRALRCRLIGAGLASIGWLIGAGLLASVWHANARLPDDYLIISVGMFVVGGGLLIAYGERQSYEELAKQYDRMAVVFTDGLIQLESTLSPRDGGMPNFSRAQALLEHLGNEAIEEHAQWLILRRARPFEMLIH